MKTLLLPRLPVTEQTLTCDGAAADSEALSCVGGAKVSPTISFQRKLL